MENGSLVAIIVCSIVGLIILIILISSIRIVKQTNKYVIERFGAYIKTWSVGIHFLIPFVDRVAKVVSMKEQIQDFPPQPVITKDNVTIQIDTIVFFSVTDPKLYTYGVEDPINGIESLTATTLRNIIGELDLDETLTSRDTINSKMRGVLDNATDPWGIKVVRVEVKNILPPKDIRDAMERQMRAERERREKILLAEGNKQSAILNAEGNKQAQILEAEAKKEAAIKEAEGQAESIKKVKEAQAEGEILVRKAEARGIEMLNNAKASKEVLTIKSYEALGKLANGQATKLIIPADMNNIAGLAASLTDIVHTVATDKTKTDKNN